MFPSVDIIKKGWERTTNCWISYFSCSLHADTMVNSLGFSLYLYFSVQIEHDKNPIGLNLRSTPLLSMYFSSVLTFLGKTCQWFSHLYRVEILPACLRMFGSIAVGLTYLASLVSTMPL